MRPIVSDYMYLRTFKRTGYGERYIEKHPDVLPLYPSELLAGIVADITADGHIGKCIVQFISKNRDDLSCFQDRISKIFDVSGKIRISPSNPTVSECLIGCNSISKILRLCGAPYGSKVLQEFEVPNWISNGNRKIKRAYLKRLFDCEGSVFFQGTRTRIKFKMHKRMELKTNHEKYLNQIRKMLAEFNIKTTKLTCAGYTLRKDYIKTIGLEFEILGTRKTPTSVANYHKHIGFDNNEKKERLNNCIGRIS